MGGVESRTLTYNDDWVCPFCESMNKTEVITCTGCKKIPGAAIPGSHDEGKVPFILLVPVVRLPFHLKEQRIVVVGKMGVGKSSFCNTLLNKEIFNTSDSFNSETSKAETGSVSINDRHIIVVDTPGFRENNREREDEVVSTVQHIAECFMRIAPGFHCIAFVLNNEERFTRDDQEVLDDLVKVFGEEIYGHMILVFTRAPEKKRLLEKIEKVEGPLKKLIEKVDNRVFAVDNKKKIPKGAAELFFKEIEKLIFKKRKIFGNEMLMKAWKEIEKDIKNPEDRMKLENVSQKVEKLHMVHDFIQFLDMSFKVCVLAHLAGVCQCRAIHD